MSRTWAANFEAVQEESPAAADVLRLSAFLAPDSIPFELLTGGASELGPQVRDALDQADVDPLLVNDLLRPLGRFSLIRIDGDAETYRSHRMVQEVLKDAMDEATGRLWAERAVRAVNQAFPPVEYRNWSLCSRLLPHAVAVASWIKRGHMEFPEAGRIIHEASYYLSEIGSYGEAEPLCRQALEVRRATLGERHLGYATTLSNLAGLYLAMGRYAEAEPLYQQDLEVTGTALGERHPDYANSLSSLAWLYLEMDRYAEAEPLCRQALEIRRAALGEGHRESAASLDRLAMLYFDMGSGSEAEPLCRQALEITRAALGERHPDYAISLSSLAWLYRAMGRYAEAEPLYRQAVSILLSALGTDHPHYLTVLKHYLVNQQEGDLPLPDVEITEDLRERLRSLPSSKGRGK